MTEHKTIVLFDGVCNLCNATVSFLRKHDKKNILHFISLQSLAAKELVKTYHLKDDMNTVILIKEGKLYFKSDVLAEVAAMLTGWPRILKYIALFPLSFRNGCYDLVAKYRYRLFGQRDIC